MNPIPNYVQKTNFRLDIPNSMASDFVINVQEVNVPSINIPPTRFTVNPQAVGSLPGSAVEFDPMSTRILLDEDLQSYADIYQWMLSLVDYRESNATAWYEGGQPKTILLHILDSTKEKILLTYRFFGAFPQTLGEIEFNYSDPQNIASYCQVTWGYKYFEIEKNGIVIKPKVIPENLKGYESKRAIGMHPTLRR
ncbi:putative tail completion and sheath stabilizer [Cronobacter phage S13]|jgi:hypothetical protein|uniref:putative tail completion and sheath stabilizer n=1 Tax=Cronobacter phage S13 TaxID=1327935 RepID=UPI000499F0A8|nr:putative tail completion and sheath stabilizer [Cronobacter phage S13]AIA64965.1 putative tail completion and sheath stabilizer [Cronobacter phage S13]